MNAAELYRFFLICTPGLEDLTLRELQNWFPEIDAKLEGGGLSLNAPLAVGFALNRCLKTPTRVLLRLSEFGCRDFPKLYKKLLAFPWENWLGVDAHAEFSASTHQSWLKIKKRIEETAHEAFEKRFEKLRKKTASQPAQSAQIFIRFDEDICTVSLDTSGELLHKRSFRTLSSEAPLRETLAASLLLLLAQVAQAHKSVTPDAPVTLVDPMTGGGTFLLEAALLDIALNSRPYAFESFATVLAKPVLQPELKHPFADLLGYESDLKTVRAAKDNLQGLKVVPELNALTAQILEMDFFAAPALPAGVRRWLVANPPYGERIRVEGSLKEFYEKLFLNCERVVQPELAAFLLPEKVHPERLRRPKGWRVAESRRLSNGGLAVTAVVFMRTSAFT